MAMRGDIAGGRITGALGIAIGRFIIEPDTVGIDGGCGKALAGVGRIGVIGRDIGNAGSDTPTTAFAIFLGFVVGVRVGIFVGIFVGVRVGRGVLVRVGVRVGGGLVAVGVGVGVLVGVGVGVLVGVGDGVVGRFPGVGFVGGL